LLALIRPAQAEAAALIHAGTILQIQSSHPAVVLLTQAYAELGMTMQLELLPAERALRELKRGELLDATVAATRMIERQSPELLRVPVCVYQLEFAVFSTDPTLHFNQWSQLLPYSVLMITGMAAVEYYLQQTPGQQIESVLSLEQALRRLELGRNQLAVLPKFEAEAMLNKLQLKNVSVLSPPLAVEPAYHYLHPQHQSLLEPLTRVLSRLTVQPGEAEQLVVNRP